MIEVGRKLQYIYIRTRKLFVGFLLIVAISVMVFVPMRFASAENNGSEETLAAPVVIKSVQTGDTTSASNEFVQIANNTGEPVDVTGWCVFYRAGSKTAVPYKMFCFTPTSPQERIFIEPRGVVTAFSETFASNYQEYSSDYRFSLSMSWTMGYVFIQDDTDETIDLLGWGNVSGAEGGSSSGAPRIEIYGSLQRKVDDNGFYQDTNVNKDDFILDRSRIVGFPFGMLYEVNGECTSDCHPTDGSEQPTADPSPVFIKNIMLSELLPNPDGNDKGSEFIELYNPNDYDVRLGGYGLMFSNSSSKVLYLTDDQIIPKNGYLVLSNSAYAFTMVNTADSVALIAPDLSTISQTSYRSAEDGKSWAIINGEWQYTDQPTPNAQNIISIESVDSEGHGATLTPCSSGQYRNPETNRCRKIAGTEQESALIPCKEGQERNPETNRCRKVTASETPKVDYAVLSATESENSSSGTYALWVIIIIIFLGLAYIAWEWRHEIASWWRKLANRFRGAR